MPNTHMTKHLSPMIACSTYLQLSKFFVFYCEIFEIAGDDITQHTFAFVDAQSLSQLYTRTRRSAKRIVLKNTQSCCNSCRHLCNFVVSNISNKHVSFPPTRCTHTKRHMFVRTRICNKLHVKLVLQQEYGELHRKKK